MKISEYVQHPSSERGSDMILKHVRDTRVLVMDTETQATVKVFTPKGAKKPNVIDVQFFDAYGYQRELVVGRARVAGTTDTFMWQATSYKHPFRPPRETDASEAVIRGFIDRFLDLCANYPTLLWNEDGYGKNKLARNAGMVRVHDYLLYGSEPSKRLLP